MNYAGKLRHRVYFQAKQPLLNSSGDPAQDANTGEILYQWVQVGEAWAAKSPLSGREQLAAQQLHSEVDVRFVIRARSDIDASMRIMHKGLAYDIAAIIEDSDSGLEWMTLPCTRGKNAG